MGYNKLQQCIDFLQTGHVASWKDVRIIIFDAPQSMDKTYAQRLETLRQSTYSDSD
jgi:hypothetical protein